MILAIKIRDNILVHNKNRAASISFGNDYFNAQTKLNTVFKLSDTLSFTFFINQMAVLFPQKRGFALYHLADTIAVADSIIELDKHNKTILAGNPNPALDTLFPVSNCLNFFCFEIENYPAPLILDELVKIKREFFGKLQFQFKDNIIEYFWIFGDITTPDLISPSTLFPSPIISVGNSLLPADMPIINKNLFDTQLQLNDFRNRGQNITIIDIERDARNGIESLLPSSQLPIKRNHGTFAQQQNDNPNVFNHQLKCLVSIFAKSLPIDKNSNFELNGIAPEANIEFCSINPIDKPSYTLSKILQILTEIDKRKINNIVLLFEFVIEIPIPENHNNPSNYPINIFKHITTTFFDRWAKSGRNITVVIGSGNDNLNFDIIENLPKPNAKVYNDLSKNQPNIITVGGANIIDGVFTVDRNSAFSKNFDVYMYTNYATILDGDLQKFEGTSAAASLTAGIVAFLQSKALEEANLLMPSPNKNIKSPLTTAMIKQVFKNTFMKNIKPAINPAIDGFVDVLTPTTLKTLWEECQKVIKPPAQIPNNLSPTAFATASVPH